MSLQNYTENMDIACKYWIYPCRNLTHCLYKITSECSHRHTSTVFIKPKFLVKITKRTNKTSTKSHFYKTYMKYIMDNAPIWLYVNNISHIWAVYIFKPKYKRVKVHFTPSKSKSSFYRHRIVHLFLIKSHNKPYLCFIIEKQHI